MVATVCLDNLPRTITLEYTGESRVVLSFVDQRELPYSLTFTKTDDWHVVVEAIKTLAVRGAPALGIAGAAAVVLWVDNFAAEQDVKLEGVVKDEFEEAFAEACCVISEARPTAVNLRWAVDKVSRAARLFLAEEMRVSELAKKLFDVVKCMEQEDEAINRALGAQGAPLLKPGARVLTHCNAGSLATVFYGTALGVVYAAAEQGKISHVYADETRPVGQGARLTVWELSQAQVPCTLICDNMAASLMAQGEIDAVIVGADRIAANGDTANKIGTYGVAVLAHHHHIPFYVAAPCSTIDFSTATGANIPIEERASSEVLPRALPGVQVWNPAFDVTPAGLIDAIITEKGVFAPACLQQALR